MPLFPMLAAALAAYLLGSIPNGYLAGRLKGIDIREQGSRNIGATNVFRVLGKGWGISVFVADFLKGLAAVLLARVMVPEAGVSGEIVAGVACILGHNFPVWLRFKGGKGIATSAGVLGALMPVALLVAVVVWAAVFFTSRYVSLASIAAAATLPVSVWCVRDGAERMPLFVFSLVIAALAIWRHRANIGRLRAGTENRFVKKERA